jgi:hypothetical protein
MMRKNESRKRILIGVWLAAAIVIVASGIAYGATMSTIALLIGLCGVLLAVALRFGFGEAAPQTVAEMLYDVNTSKDVR